MTIKPLNQLPAGQFRRVWSFVARQIRMEPVSFTIHSILTLAVFGLQIAPGLVQKAVFDHLSGARPAALDLWGLIALFVGLEAARAVSAIGADWYGWTFRLVGAARLQLGLLDGILHRPPASPLPVGPGEAVNRFRIHSDVGEVTDFPTWLPDQAGKILAAAAAVIIMASISLPITLVVFIPLVGVLLLSRLAWGRMLAYRRASGLAGDAAAGFLGEIFHAILAFKSAGAEAHATRRYDQLNGDLRRAELKESFFRGVLSSVSAASVAFGVGVMLLMASQALTAGEFTVGDFALFISYLWFTTQVPLDLGTFLGDYRAQTAALDRLEELTGQPASTALVWQHLHPDGPRRSDLKVQPLKKLEVRGLTCLHPGGGRGVEKVSFEVPAGGFVVVTGRVAAGKSSLLQGLAGLLPIESGEILWNDQPVADPASFFRPPRAAYLDQSPRLFTGTLRENILLGLQDDEGLLERAIWAGVLERDLSLFPQGLETVVGPRGLRLSGGQIQRTAAARLFGRDPDLLLIDDLSRALDVETENALWERLLARREESDRPAILAASHRQAALRQADWVIVLKEGRGAAAGKLNDLLRECEEMRLIWAGQED
jgi:ATP-binding cassette, subfamily B, bacterial